MRPIFLASLLSFAALSQAQPIHNAVAESTVLVLAGEGAGRLQYTGTGVAVRSSVILTAAHLIKDAREVQVRLRNGEVLDDVKLIGIDERRDIAALYITASLKPIPLAASAPVIGEPVYSVGNVEGTGWAAISGVYSSTRLADEIPNLGTGYRVIQFTAQAGPGASGAPIVNAKGELLGIVTRGSFSGQTFAIPAESVVNLADLPARTPLGNGSALRLPSSHSEPSPASAAVAATKPNETARNAKTAVIFSKSTFFTSDTLVRELQKNGDFNKLGLALVQDTRVADLTLQIDRPLFTYRFTWSIVDRRTSAILSSGHVTAVDGNSAAGPIAADLVKSLKALQSTTKATDSSK